MGFPMKTWKNRKQKWNRLKNARKWNTNEKYDHENISDKKTPKQTPTSVGVENMPKKRKKRLENPLFFWLSLGFREWDNLHLVVSWENKPDDQKNKKTGFLCSYFVFPPRKLGENGEKKSGKMKIKRKQMKNEEKNVKLSLCLKPITCKCTSSILCFGSILDLRVRCCHMNHSLNRLN